jgi:hypothetical protein
VIPRLLALLLVVIPLTGCLADQKRQLSQCTVDSLHTYPTDTNGHTPYDRGHLVNLCMEAAGYEFSYSDRLCRPGVYASEFTNTYCYRPVGWIGQLARRVEIAWERWDWGS